MARVLGYGVGNTNGARNFAGKTPATGADLISLARTVARFVMSRVFGRVN